MYEIYLDSARRTDEVNPYKFIRALEHTLNHKWLSCEQLHHIPVICKFLSITDTLLTRPVRVRNNKIEVWNYSVSENVGRPMPGKEDTPEEVIDIDDIDSDARGGVTGWYKTLVNEGYGFKDDLLTYKDEVIQLYTADTQDALCDDVLYLHYEMLIILKLYTNVTEDEDYFWRLSNATNCIGTLLRNKDAKLATIGNMTYVKNTRGKLCSISDYEEEMRVLHQFTVMRIMKNDVEVALYNVAYLCGTDEGFMMCDDTWIKSFLTYQSVPYSR